MTNPTAKGAPAQQGCPPGLNAVQSPCPQTPLPTLSAAQLVTSETEPLLSREAGNSELDPSGLCVVSEVHRQMPHIAGICMPLTVHTLLDEPVNLGATSEAPRDAEGLCSLTHQSGLTTESSRDPK